MPTFETRDDMIRALIKEGDKVCEIGVWIGEFAQKLHALKPSELVLIDPFEGIVSSGDADGMNVRHADLPKVYEVLKKSLEPVKNIKLIRGYSFIELQKFPDEYFDAIYIDGDHSYEGVKRDLYISLKKLKKGGWLLGHDYGVNLAKCIHNYDFGVKRAVTEFCKEFCYHISHVAIDGCISFAIQV